MLVECTVLSRHWPHLGRGLGLLSLNFSIEKEKEHKGSTTNPTKFVIVQGQIRGPPLHLRSRRECLRVRLHSTGRGILQCRSRHCLLLRPAGGRLPMICPGALPLQRRATPLRCLPAASLQAAWHRRQLLSSKRAFV